jgi:hypothetical protein
VGVSAVTALAHFGRELVGRNTASATQITRYGDPSFQSWVDSFMSFQGQLYGPGMMTTQVGERAEPIPASFCGYADAGYKSASVPFSVSMARARLFSEARFKFRRKGSIGGANLYGNRDLEILENPWPGGSTQDLLIRAEQDVTLAGTFFAAREHGGGANGADRLRRLRPDWCEFILSAPEYEATAVDVLGVKYTAGGRLSGGPVTLYTLDEIAYWAPIPDPEALFRGMSWLTPIIRELQADKLMTAHKLAFMENAATPNLAVSLKDTVSPDKFADFVRRMNEASAGAQNAGRTLYTGGGADVTVIGSNLAQLDFRAVQGAGETRIAAAGGVPPIIVGLSEGLASATYSNYEQARQAFGDVWGSSQWRSFCSAMTPIVIVPGGSELWYDTRDIPFLAENSQARATYLTTQAATINTLITAGYDPDSVTAAVTAEDLTLLKHSGMTSVQLLPPGGDPGTDPAADPNADPALAADQAELPG